MTAIPIEIPPGLENDPEVKAAMKKLALASVERAIFLLEEGSPAVQATVVRMLLPSITRSLATPQKDEDDKSELKEKIDTMYGAVLEAITPST